MHPKELSIKDFTYNLPEERIAKHPISERDQSKLLFSDSQGHISDHQFSDISNLLPRHSMLVFNNTKVVQARLLFKRKTGSTIEIFCLEPEAPHKEVQQAMQQTESCVWKCLVGNAKRWKEDTLELHFPAEEKEGVLIAEKVKQLSEGWQIRFTWKPAQLTFAEVLENCGKLPLPPYLKRELTATDRERYQTVYARNEGAVAAPTAGLHFTDKVLEQLQEKGIKTAYLTLHVGAGTFKPVKAENMQEHDMHAEQIIISKEILERLLQHLPEKVIAVGTTSMRCLESLYWLGKKLLLNSDLQPEELHVSQWEPYEQIKEFPVKEALTALLEYLQAKQIDQLPASTQILIAPGYTFKVCQGLITNFHQPESTLLLLVAAVVGPQWKKLYEHALQKDYRFLSYGDSSLLLPSA